ncbi:hypothetical protein Hanom_Chr04g00347141 [Helianthus anomalus]
MFHDDDLVFIRESSDDCASVWAWHFLMLPIEAAEFDLYLLDLSGYALLFCTSIVVFVFCSVERIVVLFMFADMLFRRPFFGYGVCFCLGPCFIFCGHVSVVPNKCLCGFMVC